MLTKQVLILALKIWYKNDIPEIVAQWRDYFTLVLRKRKAVYNLRQ
jgi:hypothetical protein